MSGGTVILSGGQKIVGVHNPTQCIGEFCTIHNPSDHGMHSWPQVMGSGAVMYRVCPCNNVHVDPDDPAALPLPSGHCRPECDGCCIDPAAVNQAYTDFALDDLKNIVEGLQ